MTHSTDAIYEISSNVPTENVEDYSIVSQDDSKRPAFYVSGDLYTQLATTRETDFNFNVFDFFIPVGGGAPSHIHSFDDEVWYIVDGEVQYNLGNQGTDSIIVPEGGVVFGPVDKTHGFLNVDSTTSISGVTEGARTLSTTTPGLLDLFFSGAGTKVDDRNIPVPGSEESTEEGFIDPSVAFKIGARTDSVIGFVDFGLDDYIPPEEALNYVIVLPEDAPRKSVSRALELSKTDGFSVWTLGDHQGLEKRPTFTGDFGIEYTSLVNSEETANKFSYAQFNLESQAPENLTTFGRANITGSEVVEPTESEASASANLELNSEGNIDYSLTVSGLDFGELSETGSFQTPNDDSDDVTAIHVHTGEQGTNGSHVFNILDAEEQDENDLSVTSNEDGSVTLNGSWSESEKEIPEGLTDFFDGGVPGTESNFYLQVHTKGNPTGEIRGQITNATDNDIFPEPIVSQDHQYFYVTQGQLSIKIGNEVKLADKDTFVYVAPGNEYSIANYSQETVKSLSVAIFDQEPAFPVGEENIPPALNPQGTVVEGQDGLRQIFGSAGNDRLLASNSDQLVGGKGDDLLSISQGGNNLLDGGSGSDRFEIANSQLPDASEFNYPEEIQSFLPDGFSFPDLVDTGNRIADFELGVDKIQISNLESVASFDDLQLLPSFGDLGSTSIVATFTEDGVEKEISLADVSGVIFTELSSDDFVFA